jgi:hypothetical protein
LIEENNSWLSQNEHSIHQCLRVAKPRVAKPRVSSLNLKVAQILQNSTEKLNGQAQSRNVAGIPVSKDEQVRLA